VRTIARAVRSGAAFDCVVLDDGFQHRFVKRDLDVVLVDARRPPDTDTLLPAGRLRESATSLRRADALVITHADHAAPTLVDRLTQLHGKAPLASCVHAWHGLRRIAPDGPSHVEVDVLQGLRVVTRLALARPEGIRRMLSEHGAEVIGDLPARDHQAATLADLEQLALLASNADAIVVSAKDMATMKPLLSQRVLPVELLVPDLSMRFLSGEEAFVNRINAIFDGDPQ
jgi:tetraacyldisaccharide 4'-kinase